MIGLDTNVLARYYVEDETDVEAGRQRAAAQRLVESGQPLMVCKSVVLELEWVLRGFYGFSTRQIVSVLSHLLGLPQVTVEDRATVEQALSHCGAGIVFSDALHFASYRGCVNMASFDDKKFARRVKRLGLAPAIVIPA